MSYLKHSIEQFITTAIAEKIATITQNSYLQERENRGNRQLYDAILAKVPDIEPDSDDQLINNHQQN
jgi:hypothetical protein